MSFLAKKPEVKKVPVKNKIGNNTLRNMTLAVHQYMSGDIINNFTTVNGKLVGNIALKNLGSQEHQQIYK